ncbi:hypothetical protein D3C84_1258820 [compost metagenome]
MIRNVRGTLIRDIPDGVNAVDQHIPVAVQIVSGRELHADTYNGNAIFVVRFMTANVSAARLLLFRSCGSRL